MPELLLIRHGQASFGAADYDVLSDLGWDQARELGRALRRLGLVPDGLFIGAQRRHRETLEGILEGLEIGAQDATVHPGLNEFDFKALLDARFAAQDAPEGLHDDRKTHFRMLRDTVLQWERGDIPNAPESWEAFTARVEDARQAIVQSGGQRVLAVSSGGAIGRMTSAAMGAGPGAQIKLQLQTKNCAMARFVFGPRAFYLHSFNEVPHIDATNEARLMTYS